MFTKTYLSVQFLLTWYCIIHAYDINMKYLYMNIYPYPLSLYVVYVFNMSSTSNIKNICERNVMTSWKVQENMSRLHIFW